MTRRRLFALLGSLIALLGGVVIVPAAASTAAPTAGTYVPLAGANLLDTTHGVGAPQAPVPARGTVTVQVAGRGGVPASGVSAVAITLIAVRDGCQTSSGWLTVYPTGSPRPYAANLDYLGCQNSSGSAIVPLGTGGRIDVYNGSWRPEHLVVNVQGYYRSAAATPGAFVPVPARNLLDTTKPPDHIAYFPPAQSTTDVQIAGRAGIPSTGVQAVALTVFAVAPFADGFLTVFPTGAPRPSAATLDHSQADTGGLAIVPLGTGGRISIYNGSHGNTGLVVNVAGYVMGGTATSSGAFVPVRGADVFDEGGGLGPLPAHASVRVQLAGIGGVPSTGAAAALITLIVRPWTPGWATAYANGTPRPRAASLEFDRLYPQARMPWAVSNTVIVPIGANGDIRITNGSDTYQSFIVNVTGYYRA